MQDLANLAFHAATTTKLVGEPAESRTPVHPQAAQTVLVVDPSEVSRRVVRGVLRMEQYRLLEASHPLEALLLLEKERVDLIIADLMLPDISGLEFCRRVKASDRGRLVPILVLTSMLGIHNEVAGLESGADEFLMKPLQPIALRIRVRSMLRSKRNMDSLEEAGTILFALAQAVESRDKNTGDHCQRLASLSVALGSAIGLSSVELQALHQGGYLHDIGKIAVPDAVLFKPGRLTEDEWVVMRSHTVTGEQICKPMHSLHLVWPIIRSHHERWDGSGYPDGLCGEKIPLLARVLQLADIFDALVSCRPYKRGYTIDQAFEVLHKETAGGWRDPELVAVFEDMMRKARHPAPQTQAPAVAAVEPNGMIDSLVHLGENLTHDSVPAETAN